MSKKNNKSRSKAYSEYLKEQQKIEDERRLKKQNNRDTNRLTNHIVDEINEISLNIGKEEKMSIDKPESKKKTKVLAKKYKNTKK